MEPHDSDPERRNLAVLSLAVIAYYWAGGRVSGDEFRVLLATIHFDRPWVLACLVWGMLFWFLYRYWLHHKGLAHKFRIDVHNQSQLTSLEHLAEDDATKRTPHGVALTHVSNLRFVHVAGAQNAGWTLSYTLNGKRPNGGNDTWPFHIPVSTRALKMGLWKCMVRAALFEKTVATLALPYFLCFLAVASGVVTQFLR